ALSVLAQAPVPDGARVPVPRAAGALLPVAVGAGHAPSSSLFPQTPIDFAPLHTIDANGKLAIGKLQLAGSRRVDDLRLTVSLDAGKLEVTNASAGVFGGVVTGRGKADASRPGAVSIAVTLDGKGLDLAAILAAIGKPREIRGGKTDVHANLTMQ